MYFLLLILFLFNLYVCSVVFSKRAINAILTLSAIIKLLFLFFEFCIVYPHQKIENKNPIVHIHTITFVNSILYNCPKTILEERKVAIILSVPLNNQSITDMILLYRSGNITLYNNIPNIIIIIGAKYAN